MQCEELEPRQLLSGTGLLDAPVLNQPLTTDPGVQQMPSVAVDPHDPGHIAVAYLDYSLLTTGYAGVAVTVSRDAGDTWRRTAVPLPAGFDEGAGQPAAQFDDQGRLFVTYMAADFLGPNRPGIINPSAFDPDLGVRERSFAFQANNGIFVARSADGGLSWDQPVAVASNLYDGRHAVPYEIMPDLAIDTSATLPDGRTNPNHGNLYVAWARYYPAGQFPGEPAATGGSQIFFAASHDGGQDWEVQLKQPPGASFPVTVIDNSPNTGLQVPEGIGFAFWSHLTVGPEGDVYVAHSEAGRFSVHHSTDGGRTFTGPDAATSAFYPWGLEQIFPRPTLSTNQFRTIGARAIAADPSRPGTVYVADALQIVDSAGTPLDEGDIIFARSTDYGVTWQTTFQVAGRDADVVNDDNDGHRPAGRPDDVTAGQVLPRLAADAQGHVALIWYDTRRDPANHRLDVFAAVSSDGGLTFSPNFRVTDQSFDADAGRFINARGRPEYYLGDAVGLALANGTAYAAWTDTRNGNQDVYLSRSPLDPPPPAPNDRFEPNDAAAAATDLGREVARSLPRLAITAGDEDWFRVQAAATGTLTVTGTPDGAGDRLRLELWDAAGATLLAPGAVVRDASGQVTGEVLTFPCQAGQTYRVRVRPGPEATAGSSARYTLDVRSLTADLGSRVSGVQPGHLATGGAAVYSLTLPAPGSLSATLTPAADAQGSFQLEVLDPSTLAVLATGPKGVAAPQALLTVTSGQVVYLRVFGDVAAAGDFTLTFANLDQFTTPDNQTLFFPTGTGPSAAVLADLDGNGRLDAVVSHVGRDVVSVLLNNGDGTFQAPRDYAVGAFVAGNPSTLINLPNYRRDLAVADFNGDGLPDVVVVNQASGDVSVLLGRGDGTLAPQRRFDATSAPFALAVADLNNDGTPDLAVVDSTAGPTQGGVLLGRGDGTFATPLLFPLAIPTDPFRTNTLVSADVNHDGNDDLLYRDYLNGTFLLPGHGDGTFGAAAPVQPRNGPGLAVADLDGDGNPDVLNTQDSFDAVSFSLGHGDGTFDSVQEVNLVGRSPLAVAAADFVTVRPDGSLALGVPDGRPDLIVVNNGVDAPAHTGPAGVVVLPGLVDGAGHFDGFGDPALLASPRGPLGVKAGDVNGDGVLDVVVMDRDGLLIIYGRQPVLPAHDTPQTARNLGTVVHLVEPTRTIVPGHLDTYYTLTVPVEAARGSGDEVLDFSGAFATLDGPGLGMAVTDAGGRLLGSGAAFRVVAPQGAALTLHVFAETAADGRRGAGAYTLDIDVLPQVVSVAASPLLPGPADDPGGPISTLALTFQGDRLSPDLAEDPANYQVTWLGPDGAPGTGDDVVLPVDGSSNDGRSVIYDPSANVDVASGKAFPTAVRQTVTLLFAHPLPPGSYRVVVNPALESAPFNEDEKSLLAGSGGPGHTVVSVQDGRVLGGSRLLLTDLVRAGAGLGDLAVWEQGTPFLTLLHDNLGALLDARLTRLGDQVEITDALNNQVVGRFDPGLGPAGARPIGALVIWLDPVSFEEVDPAGQRARYDLRTGEFVNGIRNGFVSVAGNVEVLVLPVSRALEGGSFVLQVADVPALARGGLVFFGLDGSRVVQSLTEALRAGVSSFRFDYAAPPAAGPEVARLLAADSPGVGTTFEALPTLLSNQALALPGPGTLAGPLPSSAGTPGTTAADGLSGPQLAVSLSSLVPAGRAGDRLAASGLLAGRLSGDALVGGATPSGGLRPTSASGGIRSTGAADLLPGRPKAGGSLWQALGQLLPALAGPRGLPAQMLSGGRDLVQRTAGVVRGVLQSFGLFVPGPAADGNSSSLPTISPADPGAAPAMTESVTPHFDTGPVVVPAAEETGSLAAVLGGTLLLLGLRTTGQAEPQRPRLPDGE